MGDRLELSALLKSVLGSNNVYFQPPGGSQISYPCIVYSLDDISTQSAGNLPYIIEKRYSVTLMDKDPDSPVIDKLARLPLSNFDRHFTSGNLNHDVFTIYF